MIRHLKMLLKKRKQSDRVKMKMIFILGGMIFLLRAMDEAALFYRTVSMPLEIKVTSQREEGLTQQQVEQIMEIDGVKAVSAYEETVLTLSDTVTNVTVNSILVSRDYLEQVYETGAGSAMTWIYLNEAAADMLKEETSHQGNDRKMPEQMSYSVAEDTGAARIDILPQIHQMEKTWGAAIAAQLKKLAGFDQENNDNKTDSPVAWIPVASARLSGARNAIVCFSTHPLDGLYFRKLESAGVSIENGLQTDYDRLIQMSVLQKAGYNLMLALVSFVAAGCLKKSYNW